uniref:Uncharacterized protein n=1 Tax=Caenorhabditis japonica TaxID=281687 RepID=A0A8R1ICZ2_CAEJA
MVSLSEKILSLVLPARPYALKERFLRELDKNSGSPPKTLLFQAANSVINRTVDDQMVRKSVIDFFLNGEHQLSTEALAEQCNNFLKLFRRTRNYSNQSSEVTYQKEQVIFANSHIQALFIGRLDIRGRDLDWGVVV